MSDDRQIFLNHTASNSRYPQKILVDRELGMKKFSYIWKVATFAWGFDGKNFHGGSGGSLATTRLSKSYVD
jgi:hypothetical protein